MFFMKDARGKKLFLAEILQPLRFLHVCIITTFELLNFRWHDRKRFRKKLICMRNFNSHLKLLVLFYNKLRELLGWLWVCLWVSTVLLLDQSLLVLYGDLELLDFTEISKKHSLCINCSEHVQLSFTSQVKWDVFSIWLLDLFLNEQIFLYLLLIVLHLQMNMLFLNDNVLSA